MTKRIIILFVCLFPSFADCQLKGIQWTEGLTWDQVIEKAKTENKYIFVDCFATWCQPCHLMDKEVYTDEQVGKAFNDKFVSIKVQMDKTDYDNERIKKWYNDAKKMANNYTVNSFPTFLFFYPDGKPMHRDVGYKKPEEFIALSKDALNTQKQYYAILENYQPGKLDTSELKGLARSMKNSGGDLASKIASEYLSRVPKKELANEDNINLMIDFRDEKSIQQFAVKYLSDLPAKELSVKKNLELIRNFSPAAEVKQLVLKNFLKLLKQKDLSKQLPLLSIFKDELEANTTAQKYIDGLQPERIFKKDMLFFIADFTKSSNQKGFKIFYNNPAKINKIVEIKGYAQSIIDNVIMGEEYDQYHVAAVKMNADNMPWDEVQNKVARKYNKEIADRINIWVRASLYGYFALKKDKYWQQYIEYYIQKIEKFGTDTSGPMHQWMDVTLLNNFVYRAIFFHSNDKKQIEIGLKWMEGVIRRNPTHANNIDTYANLLYKAGRTKEAIEWQEKAITIAKDRKEDFLLNDLNANLVKMQKGQPTWIKISNN